MKSFYVNSIPNVNKIPKEFSIVMDALDDTFPLLDPFEHPIEK